MTPLFVEWTGLAAASLVATPVNAVFEDGDDLHAFLRHCFRSRQRTLGTVRLKTGSERRSVRAEGALLTARGPGGEACIGLQVQPRNETLDRFLEVSRRAEAMNVEIARRKRVEADLVQQREWLRVTLSSIGDAVLATDARGSVVFMNRTAEQVTGWSAAEAVGREASQIFRIHDEVQRRVDGEPCRTSAPGGPDRGFGEPHDPRLSTGRVDSD